MPLLHCKSCHHEFESIKGDKACDWCGDDSYVLEAKTALEDLLSKPDLIRFILDSRDPIKQSKRS